MRKKMRVLRDKEVRNLINSFDRNSEWTTQKLMIFAREVQWAQERANDREAIGTKNYLGVAYFWNYEYRHYLRDATDSKRRRVHNAFIKAGLSVDGESPEHEAIVRKVCGE